MEHINIKISTNESITVDIASGSTVASLVQQLKDDPSLTLPVKFKLIYQGKKLTMEETITDVESLILMNDDKTSKKKKKCNFTGCSSTPLKLVGDCQYCQGKYCHKHRLLEDHQCSYLNQYKMMQHQRNAVKLENERTISSKV